MARVEGRSSAWPRGVGIALLVAVLLAVALQVALRVLDAAPEGRVIYGDEYRYWADARALAAGETWRPEAVWPVLYPLLLGGLVALGGAAGTVVVLQTALLFVAALLWGDVARRLTGSPLAGAVAGSLLLVDPQVAAFAHYAWPEIVHLALFAAAVRLLVAADGRRSSLLGAGLLLGLALLAKKLLWPFVPVLLLPALFEARTAKERLRRGGAFAAGLALALAPAAAVFGPYTVSPVSSAVFNLWVGINDTGRTSFDRQIVAEEFVSYEASAEKATERDRLALGKVERRIGERGAFALLAEQIERQYYRLFDRDSFFTDQLPGGAIHAVGGGYRNAPPRLAAALRFGAHAIYFAVLWLAVAGVAVMPPRGRAWHRVLLAFLAFNALVFLFVHVKSRYRIPFLPVLDLYAGAAVAWLVVDRAGRGQLADAGFRAPGRRRALVAGVVAIFLSIWYFGV